jgi:hypothetical protein
MQDLQDKKHRLTTHGEQVMEEIEIREEPSILLGACQVLPVCNPTESQNAAFGWHIRRRVGKKFHPFKVGSCSCGAANSVKARDTVRTNSAHSDEGKGVSKQAMIVLRLVVNPGLLQWMDTGRE